MVTMPQTDAHHKARGKQQAALAGVIHSQKTDPEIGVLIDQIKTLLDAGESGLSPRELANYRLMEKQYTETSRIPQDLSEKRAALESEAYMSWTKARDAKDYGLFRETLGKCFSTAGEIAGLRQPGADRYAAMLDEFEPGMSPERIDEIFGTVQAELQPLIKRVLEAERQVDASCLEGEGKFPLAGQKELCDMIVEWCGFEGRQDVSVHPFTTSFSSSDVRITSRFTDSEFYQGLAGTVHETGHGLYEAALGKEPEAVNSALSMGVHESQSLFWERHVGLSRGFWKRWGGEARSRLEGLEGVADEDIYR
jgi:carboxypeptidase Taq